VGQIQLQITGESGSIFGANQQQDKKTKKIFATSAQVRREIDAMACAYAANSGNLVTRARHGADHRIEAAGPGGKNPLASPLFPGTIY
jgi:hypothetical protein